MLCPLETLLLLPAKDGGGRALTLLSWVGRGVIMVPILQMGKLRPWDVKSLAEITEPAYSLPD